MKFFRQAPFVRFLLPFIVGIVLYAYLPISFAILFVSFSLTFLLTLFIFFYRPLSFSYKYSWLGGAVAHLFFFSIGLLATHLKTPGTNGAHFKKYLNSTSQYACVTVDGDVSESEKSVKAVVAVKAIKNNNDWSSCEGKAMMYFKKDYSALKYGDKLIVKTIFKETPFPQNPHEFDYKKHLQHKGISHTAYVFPSDYVFVGNEGNVLYAMAYKARNYLLDIFIRKGIRGEELAVASALILGFDNDLEEKTRSQYSVSGTLHVLCVSGLHVGIIYLLFSFFTKPFSKTKFGKWIQLFVLLFVIWSYAIVTGLAPSVQRSAVMFSFIAIANSLNKRPNIYNTIAASAFLLLFINPFILYEIGFQLSYLAVIGIVYIYPKLYSLWNIDNPVLAFVWSLACVAVAAQILTFPLGMFYFHQFSNYFLPSNIIVVPLATLVLYSGLSLFLLHKIPILGEWLTELFAFFIKGLNYVVEFISALPYSSFNNIFISGFDLFLFYALIVSVVIFFAVKNIKAFYFSLTVVIVMLTLRISLNNNRLNQQKIIVYNIKGHTAIDLVRGMESVFISDFVSSSKINYHIQPNRINTGVKNTIEISPNNNFLDTTKGFFLNNNFAMFNDKKIYFFTPKEINTKEKVSVSYILISGNPYVDIKKLKEKFIFEKVIIDSSNSLKNIKIWKRIFDASNVSYYSVIDSGAYIIEV